MAKNTYMARTPNVNTPRHKPRHAQRRNWWRLLASERSHGLAHFNPSWHNYNARSTLIWTQFCRATAVKTGRCLSTARAYSSAWGFRLACPHLGRIPGPRTAPAEQGTTLATLPAVQPHPRKWASQALTCPHHPEARRHQSRATTQCNPTFSQRR